MGGAVALPAITGSALIDGLLLGKVAFLKAAILTNLLLGSQSSDEASADGYGAPGDAYGAPYPSYEEPAPTYEEPTYQAPVQTYEQPADTYGSPAADPLPSYNAPSYSSY